MITEIINSISIAANTFWHYISVTLYNRCTEIILAPFTTPDMLWMLLPLLATLLLMEFYFGRYKDEELGWNTAFGNTLVLSFVAIDLFRHIIKISATPLDEFMSLISNIKIIVPLTIITLALLLMFIDFFHFLPKKIAYILSSPAYVNLIGLLGIIIVYTDKLLLDWTTFIACIILFILANLIALILYYIIPSYKPTISKILSVEDIETIEKLDKEKNTKKNKN